MTSLHDRLADLAEDAPAGAPTPDLWAAGLRRGRRVRAAAVAAAVVALVAAVGLGSWLTGPQRQELVPADVPFGDLHLPRTVHEPSPWADGTAEVGAPGPLAAVSLAMRNEAEGIWGVREGNAPYGVSAVDGSVVFLDLPDTDYADLGGYALTLSPDGTKVGYTRFGEGNQVDGFAVYDTLTGDTRMLDDPQAELIRGMDFFDIRFSGDSRYLQTNYSRSGSNGSRDDQLVVWDVATGEPVEAEGTGFYFLPGLGTAPSGVVWSRGRTTFRFDPATGETTTERSPVEVVEASYGPGGQRVAVIAFGEKQADPWRLFTGPRADDLHEVATGLVPDTLIGWRDPHHVVLQELPGGRAQVVDLRSGESVTERLKVKGNGMMLPSLAADLWANDLVDGVPPPAADDPRGPWRVGGVGVGAGLVLLVAGLLWRRRVRA